MQTLAIMNQKGGSGKTTTAVNLSAALGEKKKRVLLVDIDPQGSATSWLGIQENQRGLAGVFTDNGNLLDNVAKSSITGVDVIAASPWLVGVERALAGEPGAELMLRHAIDQLPQNRWDYLVMDCPPSLGFLSVSALTASRYLMVPVETHVMALAGLASLWQTVERIRSRLNPTLDISGIVACRMDVRKNLSKDVLSILQQRFGDLVFKTCIRENVRLAEAPSFCKPITTYDSRSSGAEDYRALADEWMAKTRKTTTRQPKGTGKVKAEVLA